MRMSPARLLRQATALLRPTAAPPAAEGAPVVEYDPARDGDPDPGEVVWAWVAFEEDPSRGKDRPVLIVAREGATLIGLMLSSRDHDATGGDEARGEQWMDVGAGGWDRERRPSEVRLDRVLRLEAGAVRREGAALDRSRFEEVAAAARALHGWR